MKHTAKARIAYVGTALDAGTMDVKELAPALLAFANLVESVNRVIGGEQTVRILLNEDSIQKGSFDVTLLLDVNILEQAKLFVGWADDTGLSALMEVLGWPVTGLAGAGIFALIKKLAGRKITRIDHKADNKAEIMLHDGDKLTTDENTLKVFLDVECRINVSKVVQPLNHSGIDAFELRNPDVAEDKSPIETISKAEVQNFAAPSADTLPDETPAPSPDQELLAKIVSLNFDKGKWKLSDGTNTFWVSICDDEFIEQMGRRKVVFASGDMLKIRYHIQQTIKNGNLSSDYIVTKVLELRKKPQQVKLDLENDVQD